MKLLLISVFALICVTSFVSADLDSDWEEYKKKFDFSYDTEEEENLRKGLYIEALEKVAEHNKRYDAGEVSFQIGINQFSVLTKEEKDQRFRPGVLRPNQAVDAVDE